MGRFEGVGAEADAVSEWILANTFVASPLRMLYVGNPKVACTSVRWALAEAGGPPGARKTPAERARDSFSREQTRELTIHDPSVHRLRMLAAVPVAERVEMLESPDWVRFSVVRDPYGRLVSGWIDRILMGRAVDGAEWFDPLADRPAPHPVDVGRMFREFVRELPVAGTPILADRHFAPQASLLEPTRFPYTHLVHVGGLQDFRREMVASDPARSGLVFTRMHVGIRFRPDDLYDRETAAIVDAVFADDFAAFGFPHREFSGAGEPVSLSANEVALLQSIRLRDERIADLAALARSTLTWSPRRRGLRGRLRRRRA